MELIITVTDFLKTEAELPILHGVDYDYEVGRLGGKRITHITWS